MQEVPTRPANQAPAGAGESDAGPWLVSYADDDDREMTAADIFRALGAGEIDMDSIAWRDGMAEWQAINEIAPLRAELERIAGARGDRKRTVMGGFSAQQNAGRGAPTPQAGQLSGTRPAAGVATPAAQLQSRSTLLGTGAQPLYGITGAAPGVGQPQAGQHTAGNARGLSPQVPNPRVADLNDSHKTANPAKVTLKSSPLARQPAPQPLPDPSDDGPESWDQEPTVSLHHDSIVSLPPEALESVVAFLPPMNAPSSPRGIFEIDSNPPPQQIIVQNAPAGRQQVQPRARVSERASESIFDEPMLPAPQIHVGPEAMRSHVNAPHPPRPLRQDSPVPAVSASAAAAHGGAASLISVPSRAPISQPGLMPQVNVPTTDDTFVAGKPKGGNFGKVLIGLLLIGGIGAGMFYMGRQTAVTPEKQPVVKAPEPAAAVSTEVKAEAKPAETAPTDDKAEDKGSEGAAAKGESGSSAGAKEPGSGRRSSGGGAPRSPEPRAGGEAPKAAEPSPAPKEEVPAPAPASDAAFDTAAASAALKEAASNASSCRQGGDPSGVANVTVTFANSGRAINANVSGPPFAGTVTGGCIASKMRQAKVPPFGGDRITVRKQVVIQ